MKKILFVDHFDSFSNNLIAYFEHKNCEVHQVQCSEIGKIKKSKLKTYNLIIFSPGPGHPLDYKKTIDFYKNIDEKIAVLGVCLGHQIMLHAIGANVDQVKKKPEHGRRVLLNRQLKSKTMGRFMLKGIAVMYNSLGIKINDPRLNENFVVHAQENGVALIVEHKKLPRWGVQFHPESFASTVGPIFLDKVIRTLH